MTDKEKFSIITETVCDHYSIEKSDLMTTSRKREITEPRFLICYFARRLTRLSLHNIGDALKKDHATVLHGERLIADMVRFNGFAEVTTDLAQKLQVKFIKRDSYDFNKWILSMGTLIQN